MSLIDRLVVDSNGHDCHILARMTVLEIQRELRLHKRVSRAQLYNYFKALKIEPIGARQKPQRYPANTAEKIIDYLGFPKIVSMRTLKSVRKKARRAA